MSPARWSCLSRGGKVCLFFFTSIGGGAGWPPTQEDLAAGVYSWLLFVQDERDLPRHNRSLGYRIKLCLDYLEAGVPPRVFVLVFVDECNWDRS